MKTFLFLYPHLEMGGIETSMVEMIRAFHKAGIRIIWMRYNDGNGIYEGWKNIITENCVEIIPTIVNQKGKWFDYDGLTLDSSEEVTAVCFQPSHLAMLDKLKSTYCDVTINTFYIIPHFATSAYLMELSFWGIHRLFVRKMMGEIIKRWDKNNQILFFSQKHIESIESDYHFKVIDSKEKLLKPIVKDPPFDEALALNRSLRKEFRLITCGRMEFPHKGYMLGLIKAYAELKPKYPQLKLDIIGDGEGRQQIMDLISHYPKEISKDIRLLGLIPPESLSKYFGNSHLNISLAGGIIKGAASGLVSIPSRHYCYNCEVYGYLPESKNYTLSDEPGEDVKKYIVDIIEMDQDSYIDLCRKSYYTYAKKQSDISTLWLMDQRNNDPYYIVPYSISFIKSLDKIIMLRRKCVHSLTTIIRNKRQK